MPAALGAALAAGRRRRRRRARGGRCPGGNRRHVVARNDQPLTRIDGRRRRDIVGLDDDRGGHAVTARDGIDGVACAHADRLAPDPTPIAGGGGPAHRRTGGGRCGCELGRGLDRLGVCALRCQRPALHAADGSLRCPLRDRAGGVAAEAERALVEIETRRCCTQPRRSSSASAQLLASRTASAKSREPGTSPPTRTQYRRTQYRRRVNTFRVNKALSDVPAAISPARGQNRYNSRAVPGKSGTKRTPIRASCLIPCSPFVSLINCCGPACGPSGK